MWGVSEEQPLGSWINQKRIGFTSGKPTAIKELRTIIVTGNAVAKPVYRVNSNWRAKPVAKISWTGVEARIASMLRQYWHNLNEWNIVGNNYKIKTEVLVCIAWADSHLGYALKGSYNYGNVGNNDRWDVVHFSNKLQGISAIGQTLNNKYLGTKLTIGDLSRAGSCTTNCTKFYATSKDNRQNNMLNCLSNIHNTRIEPTFTFRKS